MPIISEWQYSLATVKMPNEALSKRFNPIWTMFDLPVKAFNIRNAIEMNDRCAWAFLPFVGEDEFLSIDSSDWPVSANLLLTLRNDVVSTDWIGHCCAAAD